MNRVELTGRITKDIELKYIDATIPCVGFIIAVKRKFKNKDGEYDSDFVACKAFKFPAEYLSKYACKGSMVGIEGTIQTGSYEDNNGKKVYTTDVRVDNVEILSYSKDRNKFETNSEEIVQSSEKTDDVFADFGSSIEISDEDMTL